MSDLTMPAAKREKIIGIIEGDVAVLATPIISQLALSKLAGTRQHKPKSASDAYTLVLFVSVFLLLIVFSALSIVLFFSLDLAQLSLVGVPVLGAIALTLLLWMGLEARREGLKVFSSTLELPFQELINLRNYLGRSLKGLEDRTTRYFHCITNTKVTSHFVLMQIEAALTKRIEEIDKFISAGGRANLLKAYNLLQGTIIFQDGVVAGMGQTHIVPLARLRDTITQLMDELEQGIADIESEILTIKSQYEQ